MKADHHPSRGAAEAHGHAPLAEPLLDAVAAARLLSVKPSWVYEAVRAGRLPHVKVGRHIRFLRRDLEDWVLGRRGGRDVPDPREAAQLTQVCDG